MMEADLKSRILDVISAERAAILASDQIEMSLSASKKEEILRELKVSFDSILPRDLEDVRCKLLENEKLIDASMSGLRAAISLINSAVDSTHSCIFYNESGEFEVESKCVFRRTL